MSKKKKTSVVHVGRYHRKDDIRIFCKECRTLSAAGYQVSYITSDIYGDKKGYIDHGIRIGFYQNEMPHQKIEISLKKGILRSLARRNALKKKWIQHVVDRIFSFHPDIVHIHEYEILLIVKELLKRDPKIKIIYDIHEDNPKQQAQWYRNNKRELAALAVEKMVQWKEKQVMKKATAVITVTDYISQLVSRQHVNVFTVKNYPKADDICCVNDDLEKRESNYCYAGGVTEDRGITLLVKNSDSIEGKFWIAGNMEQSYRERLSREYPALWVQNVCYKGYLTREQVNEFYSSCVVGMCTLQFHPNYINALPIKLFEYMAAGIPVVISDFPLWRQIVEDAGCGIIVDPYDEKAITEAVNRLLSDRKLAKRMGDNGRRAVREKYSWEHEADILLKAYRSILECAE